MLTSLTDMPEPERADYLETRDVAGPFKNQITFKPDRLGVAFTVSPVSVLYHRVATWPNDMDPMVYKLPIAGLGTACVHYVGTDEEKYIRWLFLRHKSGGKLPAISRGSGPLPAPPQETLMERWRGATLEAKVKIGLGIVAVGLLLDILLLYCVARFRSKKKTVAAKRSGSSQTRRSVKLAAV